MQPIIRKEQTEFGTVYYADSPDKSYRFAVYKYDDDPDSAYLSNVFVDPELRKSGIGNQILNLADEIAVELQATQLFLKVKLGTFVHDWYARHGFEDFEIDSEDESFMWMKKELNNMKAIDKDRAILKRLVESYGKPDVIKYLGSIMANSMKSPSDIRDAEVKRLLAPLNDVLEPYQINLVKSAIEEAYDDGYQDGHEDGYSEGYDDSCNER